MPDNKQRPVNFKVPFYFVTASLWIFIIVHAFTMNITNDEAYSFFLLKTNYYRALPGSANTHWLNSFFMKLFNLIFGDAPGWIRLQSILAFPFFAAAIWSLSVYLENFFIRLFFYCLIFFNPYILDFFSLARGYGLALTFQAWMLVYFIKVVAEKKFNNRNWLIIFLFSLLSIASNLSYLYSVLSMAGFLAVKIFFSPDTGYSIRSKEIIKVTALFISLILFAIADLLFIKYYGKDLGFGGDKDFISSLFGSVWNGSLYFASYTNLESALGYVSFLLLICGLFYFCYRWLIKRKYISPAFYISLPLIFIFGLNALFHIVFNNPFLFGRTALQWYVPGILMIALMIDEVFKKVSSFWLPVIMITLSAVIIIHFVRQVNIHYSFEWRGDAEAPSMLKDLDQIHPKNAAICNYGVYTNYYRLVDITLNLTNISLLDEYKLKNGDAEEINKLSQFDYIASYLPSTIELLNKTGIKFEVIKTYPLTAEKLLKIYH